MYHISSHEYTVRLCNSLCLYRITVQTIVFAKFHLSSRYIYNVYTLHCQTVMIHLPTLLFLFTLYQVHSNSMARNTFLANVGLDSRNSLTHLLNECNTATDDEVDLINTRCSTMNNNLQIYICVGEV